MKKFLQGLVLLSLTMFYTGCLSAPYNQDYISNSLKPELKKVNKNICISDLSDVEKKAKTYDSLTFHTKAINKNVAEKYFGQYFTDINNYKKECFLTVNTKISKIDTRFISLDGMNAEFQLEVEVLKDGKQLFKSVSNEEYSSEVFITFALLGLSAPYKTANESLHKGLLDTYEKKIEKQLLKALKKNI